MNGYLLDTNVISEYSRVRLPDARVKTWVDAQNEDALHLSVLTLGEIRKGTTLLPAGNKRDRLERWLETELPAGSLYRNSDIVAFQAVLDQDQGNGVAGGNSGGDHGVDLIQANKARH